jgi:formylglycine-generating enzyme required for sulfatase activity
VSRAFTIMSWITSVLLACLAALGFYLAVRASAHWAMYLPPACFAAASLLLFPPIWKAQGTRAQRIRLIAVLLLAAIGMFAPVGAQAAAASFRDCADCPEMVAVPAGSFMMGSPASEPGRFDDEGPQHRVTIQPTAVSATPITRAQYEQFVTATKRADPDSCVAMNDAGEFKSQPGLNWRNPGFEQTPDHPVVCVSWEDAVAYVVWLSARTRKNYGLLTEAEFEYAARGGSPTRHWWGEEAGNTTCTFANGFDLAASRLRPGWERRSGATTATPSRRPCARFRPTASACSTWQAMRFPGCRIVTSKVTRAHPPTVRREARRTVPCAPFAAVRG